MATDQVVETRLGGVRGRDHQSGLAFMGLRYAAPPTGALRFAPPEPPPPWRGVYDATEPPPRAMQGPPPALVAGPGTRQSEDCLFLNIYTPAADQRRRPVMVWIHGGGYQIGSANECDGSVLARQGDIVVVAINYRLGVFGFTDLSPLDPALAGSASNGFRDMIAALAWVRDNISDYGGDPACVTISGESAGGGAVLTLLAAPAADGLYHRAISHSPGAGGVRPNNDIPKFEQALGLTSAALLARLRAMPAKELIDLQTSAALSNTAWLDGVVVTRSTVQAIRERGGAGVPLIAGSNRDEGTFMREIGAVGPGIAEGIGAAAMQGDPTDYLARLRAAHPEASGEDVDTMVWTDMFRRLALNAVAAATAAGPGGWLYRFDLPSKVDGGRFGATHGAEVPFTFNWFAGPQPPRGGGVGLMDFYDGRDPVVGRLALQWSNTILAFVRTGDPNGAGLPSWPRYSAGGRESLTLDETSRIVRGLDDAQLTIWGDAEPA